MCTLSNVKTNGRAIVAPCFGPKSSTPSKVSNNGVSTLNVHNTKDSDIFWFALRTTYNREKKAYEYLLNQNCEVYWPTTKVMRDINGKKVKMKVSRIPNILFAHGTFDQLKEFVYDNFHLPFLRFYYEENRTPDGMVRKPLVVPDRQMESLKILSESDSKDVIIVPGHVDNFKKGDHVRIIEGEFKGIEGHVARWHGQQRVAIMIENLCTIATAYIPSAFLRKID